MNANRTHSGMQRQLCDQSGIISLNFCISQLLFFVPEISVDHIAARKDNDIICFTFCFFDCIVFSRIDRIFQIVCGLMDQVVPFLTAQNIQNCNNISAVIVIIFHTHDTQ